MPTHWPSHRHFFASESRRLKFSMSHMPLARVIVTLLTWILLGADRTALADNGALAGHRHRVLVSTDIGGTDFDDF